VEPYARKAEPLAKDGAKIADGLPELAGRDIVFCMVSTYDERQGSDRRTERLVVRERQAEDGGRVLFDFARGLGRAAQDPLRERRRAAFCAGLGNAKVIKAGKLTFVVSGPKSAYDAGGALPRHDGARARPTSAKASFRAS